ncbi:bifunctional 2-polyprenyl-6-hydroxyphenol methylase/3-demethylubiquinol 3-O-methyltransferase UbiG [Flavobacterium sp. NKUCC04_CG]|uniref:class I SAM-dependent methyltransferase n=1 Tax=Flavobacterium sp. NKUCC04_CG TaxID=2842121 RepID=UPI001C5B425D|nr:class I SAM-dependent methyltransferase [Flavobacterium sp. NKUCC04_CG]MBW3518114.1 class I SAM-dependent methyltransferase [Flavobacterium sp. NKUCC04_CG]
MKDLFGQAILDYQVNNSPENLFTETDITETDEMEVSYLFRTYQDMPKLEQKALDMSSGKVLDIGCGAGSHSLELLKKGLDVTAIDWSPAAIEACKLRGITKAVCIDLLDYKEGPFDTLLLLMNGTGIFGKLNRITTYLSKLKSLLAPGGQILIDSSDLIYMFDEDEDGGKWIPQNKDYYGELEFTVTYKGQTEDVFDWLYLDYNTLQNAAHANGLQCELIHEGKHYDYLAKLYI